MNLKKILLIILALIILGLFFIALKQPALVRKVFNKRIKGSVVFKDPQLLEFAKLENGVIKLEQTDNKFTNRGYITMRDYTVNDPATQWQTVKITANLPPGTNIKCKAKVANDLNTLNGLIWTDVPLYWENANF